MSKNRINESDAIIRSFNKIITEVMINGWSSDLQHRCWNLQQKSDWHNALPEIKEHYGVSDSTLSQCENWEKKEEEESSIWITMFDMQKHAEAEEIREEEIQEAKENGYLEEYLAYDKFLDNGAKNSIVDQAYADYSYDTSDGFAKMRFWANVKQYI